MDQQCYFINDILRKINKLKRNREEDDCVVEMVDKYNKVNEYFLFEIKLLEMLPRGKFFINKNFPHLSPQEIFLGYLQGDEIMKNYRDLIKFETQTDLFQMVTPNLNKNLWYIEKDLRVNGLLTVYCYMNLIQMKNMLKICPEPTICLSSATYKVNDPKDFVDVINKLEEKEKKCLNFIPFLRNYSLHNTIKNFAVYYLHQKIKLVDKSCFN